MYIYLHLPWKSITPTYASLMDLSWVIIKPIVLFMKSALSRWWFQIFVVFTPIWGRFPFWLIFFKGIETTNQLSIFTIQQWLQLTRYGRRQLLLWGIVSGPSFFAKEPFSVRGKLLFGRTFDASQRWHSYVPFIWIFWPPKASCYLPNFQSLHIFQHFRISKQNSFSKFQYAKFRRLPRWRKTRPRQGKVLSKLLVTSSTPMVQHLSWP